MLYLQNTIFSKKPAGHQSQQTYICSTASDKLTSIFSKSLCFKRERQQHQKKHCQARGCKQLTKHIHNQAMVILHPEMQRDITYSCFWPCFFGSGSPPFLASRKKTNSRQNLCVFDFSRKTYVLAFPKAVVKILTARRRSAGRRFPA